MDMYQRRAGPIGLRRLERNLLEVAWVAYVLDHIFIQKFAGRFVVKLSAKMSGWWDNTISETLHKGRRLLTFAYMILKVNIYIL